MVSKVVTNVLVFAILVIAVASAGRIPATNDAEIQNNHPDVITAINKGHHSHWANLIHNRHPVRKYLHHVIKQHAKPPYFQTTETPTTESVFEDANNETVISNLTESVSTIEPETENVSGDAGGTDVDSSTVQTTGLISGETESIANIVTSSESEDASAVSTVLM